MKINQRGIEIVEVPGIKTIVVEPRTSGSVFVRIQRTSEEDEELWGLEELAQYVEALQAALTEGRRIAGQEDLSKKREESWQSIEDVPEDAFPVLDKDGDRWTLRDSQQESASYIDGWAPFRRASK